MRKIPTHLLYLQHFDHTADENLMPDEDVAVEMLQINQGEPYSIVCGHLFHYSSSLPLFPASGQKQLGAQLCFRFTQLLLNGQY